MIHSATPSVNRREERLLRERLAAIDGKLDKMVVEGGAKAPPTPPAFSAANIEEVGKLLVDGRMIRLPAHARLTVTTTIEEVRSKIFGTSEVFTHTADQIHTKLLRPMTILECLEAGLIRRIPNGWAWSEMTYERLSASA